MTFRIVATNLPVAVSVSFFAALDILEKLCWTDDGQRAARFDTQAEAEMFGRACIGDDDWKVVEA